MSDVTPRWAQELATAASALNTITDELKVQMHLGSLEAKARFSALEQRLENEQLAVRKSFKEIVAGFREVKDDLAKGLNRAAP